MFKRILHMDRKDNIVSHLGVPLDIQHSKRAHFHFLIDMLSQKLLSWNNVFLSMPTKVILINTVLIVMIFHIISVFAKPVSITNRLDSMIIAFLWSNNDRSSIH